MSYEKVRRLKRSKDRTNEDVYVICCLNRSFFLEIFAKYLLNDDGVIVVCTDRQQENALLESDHNTWTERTSMKGKLGHDWGEGTMGSKRESKKKKRSRLLLISII